MNESKQKPVFNYNIDECNRLIKKGIRPIGCGIHNATKATYLVFNGSKKYFDALRELYDVEKNI